MTSTLPPLTEKRLQALVEDALTQLGWLYFHPRYSIRSVPGWPDIFALRGPRALAIELKSTTGTLTVHQARWLDAFSQCPGIETYCWRPADWLNGTVAETLQ